jgi:hypothetical protein
MSVEEIVANIDARIAALQADIQPLLDAKVALLNSSSPQPTAAKRRVIKAQPAVEEMPATKAEPTKPAPKPKPRTGRRARVEPVPSGKLIAFLEGSDGLTSTALARQTGGDARQIRVLLKELADAGQVRKTGERSATRWRLISEEEQIAARAAEIEARMKSGRTGRTRRTRTQAAGTS